MGIFLSRNERKKILSYVENPKENKTKIENCEKFLKSYAREKFPKSLQCLEK